MNERVCVRACAHVCVKTGLVVAQGLRYGVECILEASKLAGKWDFETMDLKKKTQLKGCTRSAASLVLFFFSLFPSLHLYSLFLCSPTSVSFAFHLLCNSYSASLPFCPPSSQSVSISLTLSIHSAVDSDVVRT